MSRFDKFHPKLIAVALVVAVSDVGILGRSLGAQRDTSGTVAALGQSVRDSSEAFGRLVAGAGTSKLSREERQARLQAIVDEVETMDDALPRDTFDVGAIIALSGTEPASIHGWVREQTRLVPYRGLLRGATGVAMDRVGNSLDRALLLAEVLQRAGHTTRLAHATLTASQARSLPLGAPPMPKAANAPPFPEQVDASIDAYAQSVGADAAGLREQMQAMSRQATDVSDRLRRRVNEQSTQLAKSAALPAAKAGADTFADEREALRDHWWVQIEDNGTWSNLDPSLDAGKSLREPEATLSPDDLDPALYHTVTVRVVAEKLIGARLEEQPVVDIELRASEVMGEVLRLQHVPTSWPKDLVESATTRPDRVRAEALKLREWRPVLRMGRKRVAAPNALDIGELTAEWIEYEIKAAGRPPRTIRREVFDLLGPAARAAHSTLPPLTETQRLSRVLSLMDETEILVLPFQLSAPFVAHLTAQRILEITPTLEDLLGQEKVSAQDVAQQMRDVEPLPGTLHALGIGRTAPADRGDIVFISQPNVISRHVFLRTDQSGTLRHVEALDIVANEVSATHATEAARIAARMEHGVLDANVEAFVLGNGSTSNTADVYGSSQPNSWISLSRVDDAGKAAGTPDVRARIEADLRAGYVVVAPAASAGPTQAGAGWWRIDPNTGDTLSRGDRGWGQGLVEYLVPAAAAGVAVGCFAGFYVLTGASNAGTHGMLCVAGGGAIFGGGFMVTGVVIQAGLIVALGAGALIFFTMFAIAVFVMLM